MSYKYKYNTDNSIQRTRVEQSACLLSDKEYLMNLSERILRIPAEFGVDQYDYDRLRQIAQETK